MNPTGPSRGSQIHRISSLKGEAELCPSCSAHQAGCGAARQSSEQDQDQDQDQPWAGSSALTPHLGQPGQLWWHRDGSRFSAPLAGCWEGLQQEEQQELEFLRLPPSLPAHSRRFALNIPGSGME